MSTQTHSATKNALDRISELIRKIVEKSGNGNCIYRGEPEHYDKVSSALYRPSPLKFDSGEYDLKRLNRSNLENARNHIHDQKKGNFELLTELQHYGDETNLIDFTTDFHIALFFACNGFHDKDGRVIVLPRTKDIDKKYRVKQPLEPVNRVTAQKSIFTQPHKGYIEPNDFDTITVSANLKQWILIYLRNFQDISTQSIFNDLHGFIRNKELRRSNEANLPLVLAEIKLEHIADNDPTAEDEEEEKDAWRDLIAGYTRRLEYSPYEVRCYVEQGQYYLYLEEYDCTIEVCSKAILLQPDHYKAYLFRSAAFFYKKQYTDTIEDTDCLIQNNPQDSMPYIIRGIALLHLQDWEKAKLDFEAGKEIDKKMGKFLTFLFRQDSQSVSDFEQEYNVKLPADIAEMLTPPQA